MDETTGVITWDEVLYQQIVDARNLHKGLVVVYALVALAAIVMGVICLFVGKAEAIIELAGFALGAGVAAYLSRMQYKDYAEALEEIGPDPAGVFSCTTYSEKTADAIAMANLSEKELHQQWIAYGLLTLTLFLMGGLLLAFYLLRDFSKELLLLGVGAGMLAGSAILGHLTVKAFHTWCVVRRLSRDADQS